MKLSRCLLLFAILLLSAPIHTSAPKQAVSYKKEVIFAAAIIGIFLVKGIYDCVRSNQQVVGAQLLNTMEQKNCLFLYNKSCKIVQKLRQTTPHTLQWSGNGTWLSTLCGTTITEATTTSQLMKNCSNFYFYGPLIVTYSHKQQANMPWKSTNGSSVENRVTWLYTNYSYLNIPGMNGS